MPRIEPGSLSIRHWLYEYSRRKGGGGERKNWCAPWLTSKLPFEGPCEIWVLKRRHGGLVCVRCYENCSRSKSVGRSIGGGGRVLLSRNVASPPNIFLLGFQLWVWAHGAFI